MDPRKVVSFLFCFVLLIGLSAAYTSGGSYPGSGSDDSEDDFADGGDKPGDGTGGSDPGTESPGSCYNDVDDDSDGSTDFPGDVGCVGPDGVDEIEGLIWDTDLTTTFAGESPSVDSDVSVFFDGSVAMGNEFNSDRTGDQVGGGSVTERNIVDMGNEEGSSYTYSSNDFYSYGRSNSVSYSNFPSGTVFLDNRVVDPPNPGTAIAGSSGVEGSESTCGDGYENEGISKTGDDGQASSTTDCRADYGRVKVKYGVTSGINFEDPWEASSQTGSTQTQDTGLWCRDDNQDSNGNEENFECSQSASGETCSDGSSTPVCSASSGNYDEQDASCPAANDWSEDNGNHYWIVDGDDIVKEECTEDSSETTYVSEPSDSGETCDDYEDDTNASGAVIGCNPDGDTTYTDGDGDETTGYNRDWEESRREDCSNYNRVDGGGESGGESGADDGSHNKADNDAAGTFTEFTAYEDSEWGSSGRVWCGFESTLTVDADGPQGNGDGWAVIHNGNVVATESPDGSDSVGQSVLVSEGGETPSIGRDYTGRIESQMSCDNGKTTCLAYVDFQTGSSGWSSETQSVNNAVDDAVEIDSGESQVYTADESYSVCKNINRINEDNGDGRELIDCDFEKSSTLGDAGSAHERSPLPEACGDEPNEHLVQFEGSEVDESVVQSNGLHFSQECVDWEEDTSVRGNELTENACVFNGSVVSQGSVVDLSGIESGGHSPDQAVCLNVPGVGDDLPWDNRYNQQGSKDYGGEWIDLDNFEATEYVRTQISDPSNLGSVFNSNDWIDYWQFNPDEGADDSAIDPRYTDPKGGFALEEECGGSGFCSDQGSSTGYYPPFYGDFIEGSTDDDYDSVVSYDVELEFVHNTVQTAGASTHGQTNTQDQEPASLNLGPLENSRIDEEDDEWALTPDLTWGIDNIGRSYPPGACYGATRVQGEDKSKEDAIYANSFLDGSEDVYTQGQSSGSKDGNWIDPDEKRRSATLGELSCDLTGNDWGYGYDTNNNNLEAVKGSETGDWSDPVVVYGDITFDEGRNPGTITQDDKEQWKDACGDDRNEYLIREHRGQSSESEHSAQLDRNNVFVCADRPTDCAYNGEVYSEGQFVDVSSEGTEVGEQSNDYEICLDTDPSTPGGEWNDIDERHYEYITDNGIPTVDGFGGLPEWFTSSDPAAAEAAESPFNPADNPEGYTLEDDCDSAVNCDDTGTNSQTKVGDFVYSSFQEGIGPDDSNVFDGVQIRTWVGGSYTHGSNNGQDSEVPDPSVDYTTSAGGKTVELTDSEIDPLEDTWAIGSQERDAVGPKGEVYSPGYCYEYTSSGHKIADYTGGGNPDKDVKSDRVFANSFVDTEDVDGDGAQEGNWVDPDTDVESATTGGLSCDLNSNDWGYGYNTGNNNLQAVVGTTSGSYSTQVSVYGDINFDQGQNPGSKPQNDLEQHPNACGDDRNEYLIREHDASGSSGEFNPNLNRNNIFVCADRISDCAYNGRVYSEGQTRDISDVENEERANQVGDKEVCVDLDPTIPGGEWYDMDNNTLSNLSSGIADTDTATWNNLQNFRDSDYWDSNPGTDIGLDTVGYFDSSGFQSSSSGSTRPTGYATEDDCDPDLQACDDAESNFGDDDWFNAGRFVEGAQQDNNDNNLGGIHNKMQDQSDQFEPGAKTEANWDSADLYGSGYEILDWEDSTPGPDNWGLSDTLTDSIDNRGRSRDAGVCHYRFGVEPRTDPSNSTLLKTDKIFGNSFADVQSGDGVWRDPDDVQASDASFTCDLTGPDHGYGYDTGDNGGNWNWKNGDSTTHTVIGDIAFAQEEGDAKGFEQEMNACGDDNKEYLIDEQGESVNTAGADGNWGCSVDYNNCVYRDGEGNEIYQTGQYVNAEEPGEESGRLKNDKEVCDLRSFNQHGTWYDQDYEEDYCRENTLYGAEGVRWISSSYVNNYPNAVTGGIDDDWNKYLEQKGRSYFISRPEASSWNSAETPVDSGDADSLPQDERKVATKGFCGGDDSSEYLITQRCDSRFCETDNDIIGVAEDPDHCVLDQSQVNGVSGDEREIYEQGEIVKVDTGSDTKIMSCYAGRWSEKWPVIFLRDSAEVPLGTTDRVSFRVINVEDDAKTFDLELSIGNNDLDSLTTFTETGTNEMTVDVGGSNTETYSVEIRGNTVIENQKDIELQGESRDGSLQGYDTLQASITNSTVTAIGNTTQERRDVPGIGLTQIAWLVMTASVIYFFTGRNL